MLPVCCYNSNPKFHLVLLSSAYPLIVLYGMAPHPANARAGQLGMWLRYPLLRISKITSISKHNLNYGFGRVPCDKEKKKGVPSLMLPLKILFHMLRCIRWYMLGCAVNSWMVKVQDLLAWRGGNRWRYLNNGDAQRGEGSEWTARENLLSEKLKWRERAWLGSEMRRRGITKRGD